MRNFRTGGHLRASRLVPLAAAFIALAATAASADTRIMPNRQALMGTSIVVWGNTTLANGTPYTLDCGNGASTTGTVPDQSYIQRSCTYASANSFTVTLTVGAEVATAVVAVVDPGVADAFTLRNTKINMAIEDGLRFLYQLQFNRAANFSGNMTNWTFTSTASNPNAFSALAILAFQNQGHPVNGPNTDIYTPVVVRGLNYLFDKMSQIDMTSDCGTANNPCINVPAPMNVGLAASGDGSNAYSTPIFAAAVSAAVNASPLMTVPAGIGSNNSNFVAGKTFSEILQRLVNADAWGQSSSGLGTGGWYYNLRAFSNSDGSTTGWQMLGLLDSQSAGATIPAFVKTRFTTLMGNQENTNGTWDYQVDGNPASGGSMTRVGITLQALAFLGLPSSDPRFSAAETYITTNWTTQVGARDFACSAGSPSINNKGCGYSMFNIFKGLKAFGVQTLPGIGRPAGPGPIPADDWYADYVDNLLTNQHSANSATGGSWDQNTNPTMGWSCCESNITGITALAELILSPVAFVLPDPILFSTVGLSPNSATNPVGTNHTVIAFAQSASNVAIPGATISFSILSGPNKGASGTCVPAGCVTGADGKVSFTYNDGGGAGMDTIQAFIGTLGSNQVTKTWVVPTIKCDANGDGVVTQADLVIIRNANGQVASGPSDPRDGNSDGVINIADVRYCQLRLGQ